MNLIYTNYITPEIDDLEAEIEFLIRDELNHWSYKHMCLEIIFYMKDDETKTCYINYFSNSDEYLVFKCFSYLYFFINLYEIQDEDMLQIKLNLYINK